MHVTCARGWGLVTNHSTCVLALKPKTGAAFSRLLAVLSALLCFIAPGSCIHTHTHTHTHTQDDFSSSASSPGAVRAAPAPCPPMPVGGRRVSQVGSAPSSRPRYLPPRYLLPLVLSSPRITGRGARTLAHRG